LDERLQLRKLCRTCGAFCDGNLDLCPACETPLTGTNSETVKLLDMPNVRVIRRERITSDEEERLRRGYDMETCYQFAAEPGPRRTMLADVVRDGVPLLRLEYGPAASLLRINHRSKAKPQMGFAIDFESGDLVDAAANSSRATPTRTQRVESVRLAVQSSANV